jgi:pyroglutamyl-peptidase
MLVTGFGPFGSVGENPSALLAESCGKPFQILEVSFEAVDDFLYGLDPSSFDRLLLMGVAGGADRFRIETVARNEIGPTPDVLGAVGGPGPIDPRLPFRLSASLWTAPELWFDCEDRQVSVDAGTYLCNYAFYRALSLFPGKPVGFLHVPTADKMPLERQQACLQEVIGQLEMSQPA